MFERSLGIAQMFGHSHQFAQRLQQSTTARSEPGTQYLGHHGQTTIGVVEISGGLQGRRQLHLRVERVGGILTEPLVFTPELFVESLHHQGRTAGVSGSKLEGVETTLVIGELQGFIPEFFSQSRAVVEKQSEENSPFPVRRRVVSKAGLDLRYKLFHFVLARRVVAFQEDLGQGNLGNVGGAESGYRLHRCRLHGFFRLLFRLDPAFDGLLFAGGLARSLRRRLGRGLRGGFGGRLHRLLDRQFRGLRVGGFDALSLRGRDLSTFQMADPFLDARTLTNG